MKPFDVLKDVITEKTGKLLEDPSFDKDFNSFMIARFLSMRSDLMIYGNWINQYGSSLTNENIYRFLLDNIPYSRNSFVHYIKKNPKKKKEKK